jgi:hypothetical protein
MAKETPEKKPRGFGKFKDLMQRLVKVPKPAVDAATKAKLPKKK